MMDKAEQGLWDDVQNQLICRRLTCHEVIESREKTAQRMMTVETHHSLTDSTVMIEGLHQTHKQHSASC